MSDSTSSVPGYPSISALTDLRQIKAKGAAIPNNPLAAGISGTGAFAASKLRASMEAAARDNPYVNEPVLRAPVWVANATWFSGQVVSSTDGANAFVCRVAGAGATSGNGPTGSSLAVFSDNVARWEWIGPIRGLGYPVASATAWAAGTAYNTIGTLATSSDGYNVYISRSVGTSAAAPSVGPVGFNPGEIIQDGTVTWQWYGILASKPFVSFVTPTDITNAIPQAVTKVPTLANPVFKWEGGVLEVTTGSGGGIDIVGPNIGSTASPTLLGGPGASVSFWYNGQRMGLRGPNAVYPGAPAFILEVNGRRIQDGQFLHPGALINPGGVLLDLGAFGAASDKKVRIVTNSAFNVLCSKQIIIEPTATVWTDTTTTGAFSITAEGDSLTQGGNFSPYRPGDDWLSYVAANLGATAHANMAVGSTGFISDGGGAKTTYMQRLPRLALTNPDIFLIGGNHNDVGYPAADQVAACQAYFAAARAALPSALIVVFGNNLLRDEMSPSAGYTAQVVAETNLKTAFDSWADPNSMFVPILTSVDGAWLYGASTVDAPAPDTNLTLSANIASASSGALSANFTGATGWYRLQFQTAIGPIFKVATLTNGSAALTNIRDGSTGSNTPITTTGTTITSLPGNTGRYYDSTLTDSHPIQRGYTYFGVRYLAALREVLSRV